MAQEAPDDAAEVSANQPPPLPASGVDASDAIHTQLRALLSDNDSVQSEMTDGMKEWVALETRIGMSVSDLFLLTNRFPQAATVIDMDSLLNDLRSFLEQSRALISKGQGYTTKEKEALEAIKKSLESS